MTSPWRSLWALRPGVTYLNHGSFGPTPGPVTDARREWISRLESEPMDFFVRQMEGHLEHARHQLGQAFGTGADQLLFLDNATFAMNVVAASFPLQAGDEVLATNHEYGAVLRIWRERCQETGSRLVVQKLPDAFQSAAEVTDALFAAVTSKTRLLIVSHITSPTALILPVADICRRARERGIAICIDGPHAPVATTLHLDRLDCDFYCASGHKWLSAPFGSGFLYAARRWHQTVRPVVVSWGSSLSGRPHSWQDEFVWSGTRDPSAFLAMPAAIEFFARLATPAPESAAGKDSSHGLSEPAGFAEFRNHSRPLVAAARELIPAVTGQSPLGTPEWYGTMLTVPLPEFVGETPQGHMHPVQAALWERDRIEAPVTNWNGRRHIRVSCHLYNNRAEIELLAASLAAILKESASRGPGQRA